MIYTVNVTLEVSADSEHQAYNLIRHAIDAETRAGWITHVDAEVISQRAEERDDEGAVVS